MSDYLRCWRRKPLVQFDWRPYEKEKFGRTHRHVNIKAEMGGCGRDQGIPKLAGTPQKLGDERGTHSPSASEGASPAATSVPESGLQNCKTLRFCCLSPQSVELCPGRPGQLIPWVRQTQCTARPAGRWWGVRPADGLQLSALRAQPQPQTAALPEAAPSPGKLASHI